MLLAALGGASLPAELRRCCRGVQPEAEHRAIAASLKSGERRAIWLGALALRSGRYAELRALARSLAQVTGASLGELAEGGNAAGACWAGALPHRSVAGAPRPRSGLTARQMLELEQPLPGYLLLNTEPRADALLPEAVGTLAGASCVVAVTPYASEEMRRAATVLLPASTFAETAGTYVNLEGRWQSYTGAAQLLGAARPAWKILRVLGTLLALPRFEYQTSEQVRDELAARA